MFELMNKPLGCLIREWDIDYHCIYLGVVAFLINQPGFSLIPTSTHCPATSPAVIQF